MTRFLRSNITAVCHATAVVSGRRSAERCQGPDWCCNGGARHPGAGWKRGSAPRGFN